MKLEVAGLLVAAGCIVNAQSYGPNPLGYSVPTPRPINPAESTTNPSAQETQRQNPYLGSVPQPSTGMLLRLSLAGAIDRDRGKPHGSAPPTPPDMRVRIRRFESVTLTLLDQRGKSERPKVRIGEPPGEGLGPG